MKTIHHLISSLNKQLIPTRLFTPIFTIYIIVVIFIILMRMEKPIRRIGSRLFNVITSVISSSRSLSPSSTSSNEEIHKLPFPITSAPVVSEFPDEETAALLQTVPSKHELITFDELLQSEKQEDDPCLNCLDPCVSHANYPSYLKIDYTSPLNNTVKPYIKHVLISTGKGDWETNI